MSMFPSHDTATNTLAPIRTPLEFSLLLSSTVDVFELRANHNAASGFDPTAGVGLLRVVDMRGRRVDGTVLRSSSGGGGGGGGQQQSHQQSHQHQHGGAGLRDAELKPVFRAMQNAYVKLLQNPFYEPDRHSPLGGRGGTKITSKKFAEDMKRIGESWTPGVTSL
ncbi:hypothetical protein PWT90_00799 [Aphanocladium album]|nr:hypothetical protein PWT90_00799 [Aphanocladium album]